MNPKIQPWHLWIQDIIIQLTYANSFMWSLAMQNNQEIMLNMHELSNTILEKNANRGSVGIDSVSFKA